MSAPGRKVHWLLAGILALTLLAAAGFGVRLGLSWYHWSQPGSHDQPLQGWMPLGYVGRSWQVPPEVLQGIAGVQPGDGRRTLQSIAEARGIALDTLITEIETAIQLWRAQGD
mgnify:CR=1 FL=1